MDFSRCGEIDWKLLVQILSTALIRSLLSLFLWRFVVPDFANPRISILLPIHWERFSIFIYLSEVITPDWLKSDKHLKIDPGLPAPESINLHFHITLSQGTPTSLLSVPSNTPSVILRSFLHSHPCTNANAYMHTKERPPPLAEYCADEKGWKIRKKKKKMEQTCGRKNRQFSRSVKSASRTNQSSKDHWPYEVTFFT